MNLTAVLSVIVKAVKTSGNLGKKRLRKSREEKVKFYHAARDRSGTSQSSGDNVIMRYNVYDGTVMSFCREHLLPIPDYATVTSCLK